MPWCWSPSSACWSLAMAYEQGSLGLKEAKAKKYWALRDKVALTDPEGASDNPLR